MNESGTRIIYIISHYYSTLYHHQTFHPASIQFLLLLHALKAFYINSQVRLFHNKKYNKLFLCFYFLKMKSLIQWCPWIQNWDEQSIQMSLFDIIWVIILDKFQGENVLVIQGMIVVSRQFRSNHPISLNWVTDYVTYYLCLLIDLASDCIKNTFK